MITAATVGQVMLAAAAAVMLVVALVALWRLRRVRRRVRGLSSALETSRSGMLALVDRQGSLQAETVHLAHPARRALRWIRNPLVGALFASYRRRRRRRRAGVPVA